MALLLHHGGLDIQEIYYSMKDDFIHTEEDANGKVVARSPYAVAVEVLDSYFLPKSNVTIEKKEFRQLKQTVDETINEFLVRVKTQASKCEFVDIKEQIRDQVIYGTRFKEVETKLIEKGSNQVSINEIIAMIQALELKESKDQNVQAISGSERSYDRSQNGRCLYNKLQRKRSQSASRFRSNNRSRNGGTTSALGKEADFTKGEKGVCFRCGREGHFARDYNCPARKMKCEKCYKFGHIKKMCKTKSKFVKFVEERNDDVTSQNSSDSQILTVVEPDEYKNGIKCVCIVGGVKIRMTIDSGASTNLISNETYKKAVAKGFNVVNEIPDYEGCLKAYGNRDIKVLKKVRTVIEYNGMKREIDLNIVDGIGTSLLGLHDSLHLKIISVNVNEVNMTAKIGKLKNVQVDIQLDENVKPVRQALRRVPLPLKEKVAERLNEYLENDIIEKADGTSRWISPLVVIPKEKGKDIRLCIDMRRANQAVKKEVHPLPTFEDLVPQLHQSKVFSKLDVKNAFHQIEITPSSRDITTFITSNGLFRFKRLIFGLNSASEIFQRLMENLFINIEGILVYIDDMLIFGETKDQHDETLKKVLQIIKENGLVLNESKCQYNKYEVTFMGHTISKEGIRPTEDRIQDIKLFRAPKTKEEVRSFLGLMNYVGRFIPNLATLSEPLKILTRQNEKFRWHSQHQLVFEKLKGLIIKETKLGFYDKSDKTTIIADASPVALGAVLIQEKGRDQRVIAYASKGLTEVEKRYSQTERESLGIVWAAEKFKMYITGKQFDMITDHKSLETLFKPTSKPCARIERWILRLQSFDMKVIYKPGKTNLADPLSRLCEKEAETFDDRCEMYINEIVKVAKPKAINLEEIQAETQNDSELVLLMETLQKCCKPKYWPEEITKYGRYVNELSVVDGILIRLNRIVIPKGLRRQILKLAHEGHPGEDLMKRRLRIKVWWSGIDKQAIEYVKSCSSCQVVGKATKPEPLKITELPRECWQQIRIDIMGPLPSGHNILVIIDSYSRYVMIDILTSITSDKIIKSLKGIFIKFGLPTTLLSDNATYFKSNEFKLFAEQYKIILRNTIPYSPQSNGEVERQNLSLIKRLKIAHVQGSDWREELDDWLILNNSNTHPSTGAVPSQVMFNRVLREKIPTMYSKPQVFDEDMRYKDREEKLKRKEYVDTRRQATEANVKEGDDVLKQNEKIMNKLTPTFDTNLYKVVRRNGSAVTIKDQNGNEYLKRADQLKVYNTDSEQMMKETITTEPEAMPNIIEDKAQPAEEKPPEIIRKSERVRKVPRYLEEFKM